MQDVLFGFDRRNSKLEKENMIIDNRGQNKLTRIFLWKFENSE